MRAAPIAVVLGLLLSAGLQASEVRMQAVEGPSVRAADARIEAMLGDGRLRVKQLRDDDLIAGRRHERLLQQHEGVPVWSGEVTRQTGDGGAVSIFGTLFEGIGALDVRPEVSPEGARVIVGEMAGVALGPFAEPDLWVFPAPDGTFHLAWRLSAYNAEGSRAYFIDAHSGALLARFDDLDTQTAVGLGQGVLGDRKKMSASAAGDGYVAIDVLRPPAIKTYDLKGDVNRFVAISNGQSRVTDADLAADADNDWSAGGTVDAHTYAGWTYDYYFKRHGRHGLDNNDLPIVSFVNPIRLDQYNQLRNTFPELYCNASWSRNLRAMTYGVGTPAVGGFTSCYNLAGGLEVVAHELTHGVTQFTSGLLTGGESGALNEAFSDIMGVSVEFFFRPDSNYLSGEKVVPPNGIRDMRDPAALGDPAHYSVRYTGTADNGGVHTNSLIASHAFYLAIEGGTNRVSGLRVTGVGASNRDKIEKAFYRGFTRMLTPAATFSSARAATIQSARDLFGSGDASVTAITQAWDAVGVQ
jgi:bacillolysin